MPIRCCVPMCNKSGGHRIPRDPKHMKEWLKAICRDNLLNTETLRVCRNHFCPKDYVKDHLGRSSLFLKKSAIPSVFVWSNCSLYDDKKEEWRQTKILPATRKSRRLVHKNNRIVKKDKMSTVKEGDEPDSNTTKPKKDNGKSESVEGSKNNDSVEEDSLKTDEELSECRACLQRSKADRLFGLFQSWAPTWDGLGPTIAQDLADLSNVQLSESDIHSKFICYTCCEKLWTACHFKMLVQESDRLLSERLSGDCDKVWPKPIQVEKDMNSINGVYENNMPFNVDIKQEVLTDDEACNMEESYTDTPFMDIKVEPEEIAEQPPIIVNGVTSLKEFPNGEIARQLMNGDEKTDVEILNPVKEEPPSDAEDTELSLDCLLCTRSFHSVSGLKAHVIAHHSYQTVGRKAGEAPPSDKHVCATCRRSFTTSTDLMVHETCHSRHACFACSARFDSFAALGRHRRRCRATRTDTPPPMGKLRPAPRTRPQPEDDSSQEKDTSKEINTITDTTNETKMYSCPLCNEIFSDEYYVKIHQEVHHSTEADVKTDDKSTPMEVEMLESIFHEGT